MKYKVGDKLRYIWGNTNLNNTDAGIIVKIIEVTQVNNIDDYVVEVIHDTSKSYCKRGRQLKTSLSGGWEIAKQDIYDTLEQILHAL